ncbi:MAG: hypothetical protein Q8L86_03960 [Vicinamibacterales bacterium]|nr:hypothetical protein [Vicinamibacterales bacterium]
MTETPAAIHAANLAALARAQGVAPTAIAREVTCTVSATTPPPTLWLSLDCLYTLATAGVL